MGGWVGGGVLVVGLTLCPQRPKTVGCSDPSVPPLSEHWRCGVDLGKEGQNAPLPIWWASGILLNLIQNTTYSTLRIYLTYKYLPAKSTLHITKYTASALLITLF